MESFDEIKFSPHAISFLAQNIIFLRYVEIEGRLRKMVAVVKMRRSAHSPELREIEITGTGMRVLSSLDAYEGVLSGIPRPRTREVRGMAGLTPREMAVFDALPSDGDSVTLGRHSQPSAVSQAAS